MISYFRIYYQNNKFIPVPDDCAGIASDTSGFTKNKMLDCKSLRALMYNFTSVDCEDSYEEICQAEYTDNPPYSCTRETTDDILTVLGSSLANASAAWSVFVIVVSLSLKRIYPGGIWYKEYLEKHGKAAPKASTVVPVTSSFDKAEEDQQLAP